MYIIMKASPSQSGRGCEQAQKRSVVDRKNLTEVYLCLINNVTISAIAKPLEITHSGASQMVTSLNKKGVVEISQVREGKHLKTFAFTARGEEKLKGIKQVWSLTGSGFRHNHRPGVVGDKSIPMPEPVTKH